MKGDRGDKLSYCRTMERDHLKGVQGYSTIVAWRGVAWHGAVRCGTVWREAWRGEAMHGRERWRNGKETAAARVCGVRGCVWRRGRAWAACVGGGLARSFVECGGGGVAWVWLNVGVDGGGGGEGEGSRMKGKRKKKDSWLDEWKERRIVMRRGKNCGAHSALAQIAETFVIGAPGRFRAQRVIPRYSRFAHFAAAESRTGHPSFDEWLRNSRQLAIEL
jgi:hypothetical protein